MPKKICIVSSQHISSNPRVWKEAATLSVAGYDVSVVTIVNSAEHRERDKPILEKLGDKVKYIVAANLIYNEVSLKEKLQYKFRGVLGKVLKKLSIDSIYLLSKAPTEIYKAALNENADLYIAHAESALYIGKQLLEEGKKVALDSEDWYSRDYLNSSRPVKLLQELENYALNNGVYITCTSQAMAEALQEVYKSKTQPQPIYNSFTVEPVIDSIDKAAVSLLWFSQTIGPGRGLEKICFALSKINTPVKLVLIGTCSESYKEKLNQIFPFSLAHTLEILPQVPHHELHNILCGYTIGLALEENTPDNKNKTISNKIFQYLQAGIKVLATDTEGQREVADVFPKAVQLISAADGSDWHKGLESLMHTQVDKQETIETYTNLFSWNVQEKKLLYTVKNVI